MNVMGMMMPNDFPVESEVDIDFLLLQQSSKLPRVPRLVLHSAGSLLYLLRMSRDKATKDCCRICQALCGRTVSWDAP